MKKYDGVQPASVTGLEKSILDVYEDSLVSLLLDIDVGEPVDDFDLGQARPDWDGGDMSDAAYTVNMLCDVLGIDYRNWGEYLIERTDWEPWEVKYTKKDLGEATRQSIGEYITELAWRQLPIEGGEDGSMSTELRLRAPTGIEIIIAAQGGCYVYDSEDYDCVSGETDAAGGGGVDYQLDFRASVPLAAASGDKA